MNLLKAYESYSFFLQAKKNPTVFIMEWLAWREGNWNDDGSIEGVLIPCSNFEITAERYSCLWNIFLVKKVVVRKMFQLTTVNHVEIKKKLLMFFVYLRLTVEFQKIDT